MPNHLKVDLQQTIRTLLESGRSHRWIARELGVHRLTVKRYAESNEGSKCTIPPTGKSGRSSQCEVHRERNQFKLELGLSAWRIHQDLRLQEAFGHQLTHHDFLETLMQDEVNLRHQRAIQRRIKAARFREQRSLENFDFSFNNINREQIY